MKNNYFKNKDANIKKANELATALQSPFWKTKIDRSVMVSKIYDASGKEGIVPDISKCFTRHANDIDNVTTLIDCTTSEALYLVNKNMMHGDDWLEFKTCVLNFASFKNPGGKFLEGSMAQEEALCHDSDLYPVLSAFKKTYYDKNKLHLNRALYTDKALFSPLIAFFKDKDPSKDDYYCSTNVLTCAAPNFTAAHRYQGVSKEENYQVLEKRVDFIFKIMIKNNIDIPILGAWGCGVFGQDPKVVAEVLRKYINFYKDYFQYVVIAVPDKESKNYKAFEEVFYPDLVGVAKFEDMPF